MNYEYTFVRVDLKPGFWSDKPEQDHHEIIKQHATDGWRLVQVFAPAVSGTGFPTHFEIIFERPVQ